jgi:AcrR family transcriptional regulator
VTTAAPLPNSSSVDESGTVFASTRRRTADDRREEILEIAIKHFAVGGYRGTSTVLIAREAGVSQPYLFRLFRTKQQLFLACDQRACERVLELFEQAAAGAPPGEKLAAMGRAYTEELLPDGHAVPMMLQGVAAAGADGEIRRHVREKFDEMAVAVAKLAGAEPSEVWAFFANGILLNIVATLDLKGVAIAQRPCQPTGGQAWQPAEPGQQARLQAISGSKRIR